jgi:hypothetical protein
MIMLAGIDASWSVPLVALAIAGVAGVWVYLSDRAFTRKYGPDPK